MNCCGFNHVGKFAIPVCNCDCHTTPPPTRQLALIDGHMEVSACCGAPIVDAECGLHNECIGCERHCFSTLAWIIEIGPGFGTTMAFEVNNN